MITVLNGRPSRIHEICSAEFPTARRLASRRSPPFGRKTTFLSWSVCWKRTRLRTSLGSTTTKSYPIIIVCVWLGWWQGKIRTCLHLKYQTPHVKTAAAIVVTHSITTAKAMLTYHLTSKVWRADYFIVLCNVHLR